MKRLLTVHEFSKYSGVEKTTLRYWDEIGLFSPVLRDPNTGYRHYMTDQLAAVNFIVFLSKLNIPLKIIKKVSRSKTPESIIRLLEAQQKKLDIEMRRLLESYSVIHERLEMLRYGVRITQSKLPDYESFVPDFTVRHMEEGSFILGPGANIGGDVEFHDALMAFRWQAEDLRINLSYPIGSYYRSMEAFVAHPDAPDNLFSSDPNGNSKWPEGDYLTGYARGYYGDFGDVPEKMEAYAKEHNLALSGPVFQMYLHDEVCLNDPSRYLVQFSVSCMKRER